MEKFGWLGMYVLIVICAAAIPAGAQTFATLHSFNQTDGSSLYAGLVQATDGNFYGTTWEGGANGAGTAFKITPKGDFTTLYSFCKLKNCTDGSQPYGGLIQATDGSLYGTTELGGAYGFGTVFKITTAGTLTKLHSFNYTDGAYPVAAMIEGFDGNFYGASSQGGTYGNGTIFKMTPQRKLTTLHNFCAKSPCRDGSVPATSLIQATDGDFYGTTSAGGNGEGTAFRITPAGTLTALHSFCSETNCADGAFPSALIEGTDGKFYGTAAEGGAYRHGTVFTITGAGVLTTLHAFKFSDGRYPGSAPVQGTDGNFYGTTFRGGPSTKCVLGCGTVFVMTPDGTLATLYRFDSTGGSNPVGALIQATDGAFYGTTLAGGSHGDGTVFRLGVASAVAFSPSLLNFGDQVLDEISAVKTVTLKNNGSSLLNIDAIVSSGSGFAISGNNCGAVLQVGKTCRVSMTFTPTALGKVTGALTVTDNAAKSPQTVDLSGVGTEPANLTPASAIYGSQPVGSTSSAKIFTLRNDQSLTLNNIAISTSGDFAVSATTCTTSLAARQKCTISVTFTPKASGTRMGQLRARDSANNSPQTVVLTGTGK